MKKLEHVTPVNQPLFDEQKKAYFRMILERLKKKVDKKN